MKKLFEKIIFKKIENFDPKIEKRARAGQLASPR
jgi:hypothetical protein